MFSIFKKKPTQDKSAQDKATPQQIAQLLNDTKLYGKSLMAYVQQHELRGEVLNVQLRISPNDDTRALEKVYENLQQMLYPLGVAEVNFDVVVSDQASRNQTNHNQADDAQMQHAPKAAVQTHTPTAKIPTHQVEQDGQPTTKATKQSELAAHPRIRHIVAVASGKGGVGKSTTTVNLALALQAMGKKVGVLDADIYGPSMPAMFGVAGVKPAVENDQFIPIDANGIALLSIGNLLDGEQTPVAWRGIKAVGALMQLYSQTNWPQLDYLLIDMPPGTGDITLSMAQKIPVTGAVIVTTPQHIALLDAQKGIEMFAKTDIKVLGVVENMALHTCSACGHSEAIFGAGGGEWLTEQYQVPLLGQLPLVGNIRAQMDNGTPQQLDSHIRTHYADIAAQIDTRIGEFAKKSTARFF